MTNKKFKKEIFRLTGSDCFVLEDCKTLTTRVSENNIKMIARLIKLGVNLNLAYNCNILAVFSNKKRKITNENGFIFAIKLSDKELKETLYTANGDLMYNQIFINLDDKID